MMGAVSKFNFIPFVCASALFFIGISYNNSDSKEELIVASVCFSFVGFVCLSIKWIKATTIILSLF